MIKNKFSIVMTIVTIVSAVVQANFTNLILNEIGTQDEALFVEIFNSGSVDIPMEGVTISRNDGASSWTGQASDIIPAGAYRIILARNGNGDGSNTSNNPSVLQQNPAWMGWIMSGGISNSSTLKIAIIDPEGEYIDVFIRAATWDNGGVDWGNSLPNNGNRPSAEFRNYSRMSDGTWAWALVTPGEENKTSFQSITAPSYLTLKDKPEPVELDPIIAGEKDLLAEKLLILQAYGSSSDAAGATHSFVELYNNTDTEIDLDGITLYYAAGTNGNPNLNIKDGEWKSISLSGKTIPSKKSFLILGSKQNSTGRLEIIENSGDINDGNFTLSNRAFKVALIRNQNADLTVQNPFSMDGKGIAAGYIDMVGTANTYPDRDLIFGFEGALPARNSASVSVRRKNLDDTDDNENDFESIDYRANVTTNSELEFYRPKNTTDVSWNPIYDDSGDLAKEITEFKFSYQNLGWGESGYWEGEIDHLDKTITFTTQRWIKDIDKLVAVFELDGEGKPKVNGKRQTSGFTQNDFRKKIVYTVGDFEYTVKFISPQATGIPVIMINTNGIPVNNKENWVSMKSFILSDPNNPKNNIDRSDINDGIRGRGNTTWWFPKKPYRIKFDKDVSLFGLAARKNWILLAEYLDPTFLTNAVAFELGRNVFDNQPFTCTYQHVHLYDGNGNYQGIYGLTEHRQEDPRDVGAPGRVKIGENGWFVEIDEYYKDNPKFMTNWNNVVGSLLVQIKAPEAPSDPTNNNNPFYDFVKNDWNKLTDLLASADFPENGYRDLIDMNTFIDFLMANEIVRNGELWWPKSVFAYKNTADKICMGPLWDFDWAYSGNGSHTSFFQGFNGYVSKGQVFFKRFFDDPVFLSAFKERWNEKKSEIAGVTNFINDIGKKLETAANEDTKRWRYPNGYAADYPVNYLGEINRMTTWWGNRVNWLDVEINKVEVSPTSKTFASKPVGYPELPYQKITLVSYGEITGLSATIRKNTSSAFEGYLNTVETENGGFLYEINIRPKNSLAVGTHSDYLDLSGWNQGKWFGFNVPLNFVVNSIGQEPLVLNSTGVKTYGDPNFTLTTSGGSGSGAITFNIFSGPAIINKNTGEVEITGVGYIYAYAQKAASGDYSLATTAITLVATVGKAIPTADLLYYDLSANYDGTVKIPNVTVKSNVLGLGKIITLINSDETLFKPINAGTYHVYVSINEGDNYLATDEPIYLGEFTIVARYDVKFNTDGGSSIETQYIHHGSNASYPNFIPTKTGHTFAGWYFNDYEFDFAGTPITQNITLTAKWVAVYYDVEFNSVGGGNFTKQQISYGNYASEPTTIPNRVGYTFAGWYLNNSLFDFAKTPITGNITLTAKWDEIYYDVEFNSNGGSNIATKQVNHGKYASEPIPSPTKVGYTFAGWYIGDAKFNFSTPITQNITLTAKWNINSYLISFEANGVILQSGSFEYETMPKFNGSTPTKEQTAQYTFKFTGWSPEITAVSKTQIYTAVFSQTIRSYEIKFVSEQNTVEIKNVEYGTIPTFTTPTKEPTVQFIYEFKSWLPALTEVLKEQIYVAQFAQKLRPYKIHFVSDGDIVETKNVYYGSKISAIDAPTKDEHIFIGWHHEDIEFDFSKPIMQDIVLTAKWDLITSVKDIPEYNDKYGIIVVKNPVSDNAEFIVKTPEISLITLVIYDNLGNIVYNAKSNNGEFVWNLLNNNGRIVTNGTYLVVAEAISQNGIRYRYSAKLGVKK